MVLQDLGYLFDSLDIECKGYLEWIELQQFDEEIYHEALDIEQLEAAISTVCGSKAHGKCTKEYFPDVVKEIDRRHVMEEQIRWDFCALDVEKVGRISIQSALFLFKAVLGERFSKRFWKRFLDSRIDSCKDICFEEIKITLCSIPDFAAADSERDYDQQNRLVSDQVQQNIYRMFKELEDSQNDDTVMAAKARAKQVQSLQIKNRAYHLLNRMDEVGMQALLEDDFDDGIGFEGRPKDRVAAADVFDVLSEKYQVLRDKLLLEMLQEHFGMGMWQSLSEFEQQEKLFQLKIKEEKLRKESQLETMAKHLPGSGIVTSYNLFTLMGESIPEMENRMKNQEEKALKSALTYEEIENDFANQLVSKEKEKSSSELTLIAINHRYNLEKDHIVKRLQGLSGYAAMDAKERENFYFGYVLARLRGIQESSFYSCATSVGLSERIEQKKNNRMLNDKEKQNLLGLCRVKAFRQRHIADELIIPPKIFPLKSKLGRIDIAMQLLQEAERMFALEREALLDFMFSREYLHFRLSARKLSREEKYCQLTLLHARWESNSSKSQSEKLSLNRKCLQEAVALKFESTLDEMTNNNDMDIASHLLACLQLRQDEECRKFISVGQLGVESLTSYWKTYTQAITEENFKCIASIVFSISEISEDEKEIIGALEKKYDVLRDKLMLETLMNQFGKAEWDKLSEQERQNELFKLKLLERKLKREGKYDELSKLLDDSSRHSETLNKLLGQNRQQYLEKLNDRLKNRQHRIALGEDPDDISEDEIEFQQDALTGNILKDLDKRFDDEKNALLKRLRDEHDMNEKERERHAQLLRLRLEARKAAKENNLDGAALVLGLAERNKANLSDRLKNDRQRQEQLAKERLAARKKKMSFSKDIVDSQPSNDDITGWQDFVLKELERKHDKERNLFCDILQDEETKNLRNDARHMNEDTRCKQLNRLRAKREELDLEDKSDQEEHFSILEMAAAIKYVITESFLKENSDDIFSTESVIVSVMADLQQVQDIETETLLNSLPNKTLYELLILRNKYIEEQNQNAASNVAKVVFTYHGPAKDEELLKAVDKKYNILMDKLALEALQKQMGNAEWLQLSEKERQAKLMRLRLEQRQLLKDGKLDEAARLLGDGFRVDANIKILMEENKKKQNEILQKRLEQYRQKLAKGEDPGELPTCMPENDSSETLCVVDGKALLEDLQKRHENEKEALLNRLRGVDSQYLSEKERQAELAKLKREQRRVQQEEKFGAASLVIGIAEQNQAAVQEKFKNDRQRQEQLAKERLEQLRKKKHSQVEKVDLADDVKDPHEALFVAVERRHVLEREDLVKYLQNISMEKVDGIQLLSLMNQRMVLEYWKAFSMEVGNFNAAVNELAALKFVNRMRTLKLTRNFVDNIIVSILADLQQCQDQESDGIMKSALEMDVNKLNELLEKEKVMCHYHTFSNISYILAMMDEQNINDNSVFIKGLEEKFVALEDKLIISGLEKKFGKTVWKSLSTQDHHNELLKVKQEQKRLNEMGKNEEAIKLISSLIVLENKHHLLLGLTKVQEEERLKKKAVFQQKMSEAGKTENKEVDKEIEEIEKALMEKSTGNILKDLKEIFEAEKRELLLMLENNDSKVNSEHGRQLKLARLWHNARQAFLESNYNTAVLRLLTSKSQEISFNSRISNDWQQQELLAKERLEFYKNAQVSEQEKVHKEFIDFAAADTNSIIALQDAILNELEKKHISERNYLINLIHPVKASIFKKKKLLPQHCSARLVELKELYQLCQKSNNLFDSPQIIFEEAFHLKLKESEYDGSDVKFLADLQNVQDTEVEQILSELVDKSIIVLKQFVQAQQSARQRKLYNNIAEILFEERGNEADELVQALKEKYDAIKMKLYEEALRMKFGEEAWENMAEQEKSKYLAKMKAEELLIGGQRELDLLNLPEMEMLMGKETQNKKLKEQEERIKKLKEEGKTEEEINLLFENEDDSEGKKVIKGKDIIKDLQNQFESEKEALLEMVRQRDVTETNERGRQLELCRLRQEKKRIQREDKYNGAALLFTLASKNEKNSQQSMENERARQQQLAKQRILACRERKRKDLLSCDEILEKEEDEDAKDDLVSIQQIQREGTIALQESLLLEIEKKHSAERDAMVEIFEEMEVLEKRAMFSDHEKILKIQDISRERERCIEQFCLFLSIQPLDNAMSETEKNLYNESLLQHQRSSLAILKEGMAFKVALENMIREDPCVFFMTKLQEQQTVEINSTMKILMQINRETLKSLKDEHRKARRGGWMDNIASLIFMKNEMSLNELQKELEAEEEKVKESTNAQIKELEKEIEKEKETILSSLTKDEVEGFMKELKEREHSKRMVIEEQAKRQRDAAQQRLEEKRRKRDGKTYENDLAHAMLANAEKRGILLKEKISAVQGAQKDELEERLRMRREERKRKQDLAEQKATAIQKQAQEKSSAFDDDNEKKNESETNQVSIGPKSLQDNQIEAEKKVFDLVNEKQPEVKIKKVMPPLPGGGMKREKTVVEQAGEISDNKKKHMINVLMREQTSIAKKINREQERQEELVRELREKRRKKMEAREMEAAAVIGLGARQKTIVEDRKKGERERQIEQIRERVNRIKSARNGRKEVDQNNEFEDLDYADRVKET